MNARRNYCELFSCSDWRSDRKPAGGENIAKTAEFPDDGIWRLLVLFCASGTGLFGSMQAGMTGDHSKMCIRDSR